MARSETLTRAGVAALGIPIALLAVYLGGWVLGVFLAAFAALGSVELFRMAAAKGVRPLHGIGAVGAAGFVLLATAAVMGQPVPDAWLVLVLLTLAALTTAIWARGVAGSPLFAASATVFGAVYVGATLGYGVPLRHLPGVEGAWHGTALVFAPVLLTWSNDTAAYFVGRRFGRRKLVPKVSPGKTVEGSLGGLAGTVLVALLYSEVLRGFATYSLTLAGALLFGILMSIAAQTGDLAESLLKRDAGVKDSGTLLPGHGGVLDRVDSLLFTIPLAYAFFRFGVGA